MKPATPLGRVVATELKPSTPHQFHFWTARDTPIGIGAIVRVEDTGRQVFGVVTDGFAYSDLVTPMHAVIGADGDPVAAGSEPTRRTEIRLYAAAVLRQVPEEPLQPVPLGAVWLATDADVALALRMDAYLTGGRPTGVPVGLYAAGGLEAPVFLDGDFLLGPEAAHLNITGVSGLATKTSAVEFLLGSIFQTFPAHKGSIAALCFNVKGPDLCFLDQPPVAGRLDERDLALLRRYERLRDGPFRPARAPLAGEVLQRLLLNGLALDGLALSGLARRVPVLGGRRVRGVFGGGRVHGGLHRLAGQASAVASAAGSSTSTSPCQAIGSSSSRR